jgi:hydrogenase/urease accessory protein HupE
VELAGRVVQARLELNALDLDAALKTGLAARGPVAPEALQRARPAVSAYLLQHARVVNTAGGACRGEVRDMQPKVEHVIVAIRWSCPPMTGTLAYHVTLFQEIDPAARHMVTVTGEVRSMGLLSASSPRLQLARSRAQVWEVAWHYLLAGIEHIAIGYDHVAFLVAVILWGRRLWPLVAVVTAFTVAHSLTLTAAVLEIVSLPSRPVEILIALSIVYVAAENFFVRDLRHRWVVTFVFGLVHGFGFAGVLKEYGIPRDALIPALAAFNAGVEIGQVAIVLIALGALRAVEAAWRAHVRGAVAFPRMRLVHAISWAILALGLYWTVERALA